MRWNSSGLAGGWRLEGWGVAVSPAKFIRDVRAEAGKVTWPSRRETTVTTGLVLAMAALTALFFFVIDQGFGFAVRALFGGAL